MVEKLSKRFRSPIGNVHCLASASGLCGVYFDEHKHPIPACAETRESHPHLDAAIAQLQRFLAGESVSFSVATDVTGTSFQKSVWAELVTIPIGETRSYGELARSLGDAKLARAVGTANGRNPLSIIVPCPRVVGANGSLTGYAGGLHAKRWLLHHEARMTGRVLL